MHVSITVTIKFKKKLNIYGGASFESIWNLCLFKNMLFTKIRSETTSIPAPFIWESPTPREKKSFSHSRLHLYKTQVGATRNWPTVVAGDFPEVFIVFQINSTRLSQTFRARDFYQ